MSDADGPDGTDEPEPTAGTALVLTIASRDRNLELMTDHLESVGYEVRTASTLAAFDELLSASDGVSVVVLDVDGFTDAVWERCERLKSMSVPILVLARRLPAGARRRARTSGAHSTLEKPIRKAELRGTVRTLARAAG